MWLRQKREKCEMYKKKKKYWTWTPGDMVGFVHVSNGAGDQWFGRSPRPQGGNNLNKMKQSVKIRDNVDTKGFWGSSLSGEWHIVTHFETFRMKEADSEFVMMHQCRMVSKSCLIWTMRRKTPDPFSMRTQCKRKRLGGGDKNAKCVVSKYSRWNMVRCCGATLSE